jgi:alpha-glucosidase
MYVAMNLIISGVLTKFPSTMLKEGQAKSSTSGPLLRRQHAVPLIFGQSALSVNYNFFLSSLVSYRLLDYIYTAFHQASIDGTPVLHPVWFKYPKDRNTFNIEYQFFYGDSILVSPVTEENATSVTIYLPKDIFYDFKTFSPVVGNETFITLTNVDLTELPLHIKGGCVLPLRAKSAMTTTALRKNDIEIIVAPDSLAEASGQLYVDDGESLVQMSSTLVKFQYKDQKLVVFGDFDYPLGVNVSRVRVLGVECEPRAVGDLDGSSDGHQFHYDSTTKVLDIDINQPFTHEFELSFQ